MPSTVSPKFHGQNESIIHSRLSNSQGNVANVKYENKEKLSNSNSYNNQLQLSNNEIDNNFVNNIKTPKEPELKNDEIELYFQRWVILSIFCLITLLSAFNWIEYSIIQDVVIAFYNESLPINNDEKYDAVNWLSMVYMLAYIPLVFPTMFLLDRKGLKLSIVLGALINCLGAIVKCFSVRGDLFLVAILGQTLCAIAQAFTLGIPARLSALWFGQNEVGTATSIGVFGNQLGTAIGFLIPPNVVKIGSKEEMKAGFYYLLIPVCVICLLSVILAIIFVKDKPPKPPTIAQLEVIKTTTTNMLEITRKSDFQIFKASIINLFKNLNFWFILISYGIITGTYYGISTLLNQMLIEIYPGENEKFGIAGLILVLAGLLGAVVGGVLLDKTKAFKLVTLIIYFCSFLAMILFTFTLKINLWIVFVSSFLLGFFMTGYLPVGFELVAEISYPEPEGTSCGLLNTSAQIFGIFYTYVTSQIINKKGPLVGNLFISGSLLIGTIITAFVKSDLKRQKAINSVINTCNNRASEISHL